MTTVRHTLVRTSSLGDVVLAAAFTRALAPVRFVTHARYHALVRGFPGVVEVVDPDAARQIPRDGSRWIDLQSNLRSWRLPADRRVARQDLRRRLRPAFKWAPASSVLARYAAACGVPPAPLPWLRANGWDAPPDAPRLDPVAHPTLVLVPGAAHATKRWPWFAQLARAWTDGPVVVVGSDAESELVAEVAQRGGAGAVTEAGFARTIPLLASAGVVVAGDTGLLHLAAALGTPVVALFGPTHPDDGFFSYADGLRQRAVGAELPCRPCSRFGGAHCPVGDHACLRDVSAETVLAAARAAAGWGPLLGACDSPSVVRAAWREA